MTDLGRGFDTIAELYDEVRPDYPDELYDAIDSAIGGLSAKDTLDLAAGTGIATRALTARGAAVVALEPGEPMLRQLRAMSPSMPGVLATAERIPFKDNSFSLVACATAWHWFDTAITVAELRRVLRPGGHIALWWANNRWGDGVPWEEARRAVYAKWSAKHGSRPVTTTGVRPSDAAEDLRRRGIDVIVERDIFWTRERTLDQHVRALATHSDVIALAECKSEFLQEVRQALAPWPVVTERLYGPLVVAQP